MLYISLCRSISWHLGLDDALLWGLDLPIIGEVAHLASTHWMPVTAPSRDR